MSKLSEYYEAQAELADNCFDWRAYAAFLADPSDETMRYNMKMTFECAELAKQQKR